MSKTIQTHPAPTPCADLVRYWTAASSPDPFERLDAAMSVVRDLSHRIAAAIDRHDLTVLDQLVEWRTAASANVDELLAVTGRMVSHV